MKKHLRLSCLFILYLIFTCIGYSQNSSPANYEPSLFEGSTVVEEVYSPSLEGNLQGNPSTQPVQVYLPPGYDDYPDNEYPVVYFLHGYNQHYNTFNPYSGLNRKISQKLIVPMIVVIPNGSTKYEGSFYTNSYVSGNWEDYIVQDIVPYIDSKYKTLVDRNKRVIAGHCMGGFGAMYLSMKHPEVFGLVASHSSEFCIDALARAAQPMIKMENPNGGIAGPDPAKPFTSFFYMFSAAYSPNLDNPPYFIDLPFDDTCGLREEVLSKWAAYDPIQMFPEHLDALRSLKGIYLDVGDKDELQSGYFMTPFSNALDMAGVPHFFEIFDGMHYSNLYTRLAKALVFLSDSLGTGSSGPTDVPGGNVSGTWTRAGSPYLIKGEISIPDGLSLSIEPGVVVDFTGHYKMNVQGSLVARGTAEDSIRFTAVDKEAGWHGIKFIDTPSINDSSIFEYCVFEYGKANTGNTREDRSGGAMIIPCDKVRVSHCLFQYNMCYHQNRDNGAGGVMVITGSPLIEYCEFRENRGTYGSTLAIFFEGSDPLIRNNYFHHNDGHGTINMGFNASPVLVNNIIANNHVDSHGHLHFASLKCDAVLINNTIVNNSCSGPSAAIFINNGVAPIFINNIICGNESSQVHLEVPSSVDFYNCLIEGGREAFSGQAFTGTYQNIIDSIPLFADALNEDFHLADNSPCISAGADSVECGGSWYCIPDGDFDGSSKPFPPGTAPDLGAFESPMGHALVPVNNEGLSDYSPARVLNYPNPFEGTTTISYSISQRADVSIRIFDIQGKEIAVLQDRKLERGSYSAIFDGSEFPAGIYICRIRAGSWTEVIKMSSLE